MPIQLLVVSWKVAQQKRNVADMLLQEIALKCDARVRISQTYLWVYNFIVTQTIIQIGLRGALESLIFTSQTTKGELASQRYVGSTVQR